eukprot:g39750.t1
MAAESEDGGVGGRVPYRVVLGRRRMGEVRSTGDDLDMAECSVNCSAGNPCLKQKRGVMSEVLQWKVASSEQMQRGGMEKLGDWNGIPLQEAGGVKKGSAKIPTTAFVAIALMRSRIFFHKDLEIQKHLNANISKAIEYLSEELANIERPYSLTITAYALALFDPESSAAREADEKLKAIAIYDQ